jgi:hypothetical protein
VGPLPPPGFGLPAPALVDWAGRGVANCGRDGLGAVGSLVSTTQHPSRPPLTDVGQDALTPTHIDARPRSLSLLVPVWAPWEGGTSALQPMLPEWRQSTTALWAFLHHCRMDSPVHMMIIIEYPRHDLCGLHPQSAQPLSGRVPIARQAWSCNGARR